MAVPPFLYAEHTSGWKEWQLEYRYGGFYIFPPAGIIEDVDALRRRHDPRSHLGCQAHVSLSEPLPRGLDEVDLCEIGELLRTVAPIMLTYDDVHATVPYPGVVYRIKPVEAFMQLRGVLHCASVFRTSPLTRIAAAPHMTIAEFVSVEGSVELAEELRGRVREGQWLCREIEYAIPDEKMRFRRVLTLPLGDQHATK